MPGKAVEVAPSAWDPVPHVGSPGSGSELQPGLGLAVGIIWGVSQQMEACSPALPFK